MTSIQTTALLLQNEEAPDRFIILDNVYGTFRDVITKGIVQFAVNEELPDVTVQLNVNTNICKSY